MNERDPFGIHIIRGEVDSFDRKRTTRAGQRRADNQAQDFPDRDAFLTHKQEGGVYVYNYSI